MIDVVTALMQAMPAAQEPSGPIGGGGGGAQETVARCAIGALAASGQEGQHHRVARRKAAVGVARAHHRGRRLMPQRHGRGPGPIAVDDHGFAFQRVYPGSCGVIDVGERTTQVIGYGTVVPFVARFATGGADFTQAIADALGLFLIGLPAQAG